MDSYILAAIIGGVVSFMIFFFNPSIQMKTRKRELSFDAMDWTCGALLYYISNPASLYSEESKDDIINIHENIFLYGTENEMKVLSFIKPTIFSMSKEENKDKYFSLAASCLLLNVIKRETYKKPIKPDYVFKTVIKDYNKVKLVLDHTYNQLVDDLKLDKEYRIV